MVRPADHVTSAWQRKKVAEEEMFNKNKVIRWRKDG
jgi:hypothetical protein